MSEIERALEKLRDWGQGRPGLGARLSDLRAAISSREAQARREALEEALLILRQEGVERGVIVNRIRSIIPSTEAECIEVEMLREVRRCAEALLERLPGKRCGPCAKGKGPSEDCLCRIEELDLRAALALPVDPAPSPEKCGECGGTGRLYVDGCATVEGCYACNGTGKAGHNG